MSKPSKLGLLGVSDLAIFVLESGDVRRMKNHDCSNENPAVLRPSQDGDLVTDGAKPATAIFFFEGNDSFEYRDVHVRFQNAPPIGVGRIARHQGFPHSDVNDAHLLGFENLAYLKTW